MDRHAYNRSLGDLIVAALVGRDLIEDSDDAPFEWQSVEQAFLLQTALELKGLNVVMAAKLTCDDGPCEPIHDWDRLALLRGITARVEAGAELMRRLRRARWGHPNFGGGENWAAKQKRASEPQSSSRVRAANVRASSKPGAAE